jgi:L-2-hydroxyglutarate oxidase LhgO
MRVAVIGGGIVGLACARLLAEQGHELILFEKEATIALHQTAHNSGVAHAGLYYAPGSLKARLCRRGVRLLQDFCARQGLEYRECGKLVIALHEGELPALEALADRAAANGVPDLAIVDERRLVEIEPNARGIAALHSPHSAIVDFASVARALAALLEDAGGQIRVSARVVRVCGSRQAQVQLADGETVLAQRAIVCAGLQADRLARASGQPAEPAIVPFRGEYWRLTGPSAGLVRGLIYPVADPSLPFLGVHLTRRLDGSVLVGPNAVLALAREGYLKRQLHLGDALSALAWPGTARMVRRHWRAGVGELARSLRRGAFAAAARRYVPELASADLAPAPAGVRAQAIDRDGTLVDDFRVTRAGPVVWVRNAPSPAATSALAIAEELAELALDGHSGAVRGEEARVD